MPYKGPAKDIILDVLGGLRSACAYIGATKLKDMNFLIPWKFVHNEEHWRCEIMYSSDPNDKPLFLDIEFEDYNKLPSATKGEKHETH